MKNRLTKLFLLLGMTLLMISILVVVAFAEKTDFAATDFTDITAANGWVHIGSKSAVADDDGKDIELYYISGAEAYLNRQTKTLVILGKGKHLTGSYGDWNVSATKNSPGAKYYLIWWADNNSSQVEHIEFRDCSTFVNACYILQKFKHAKTIKFAPSVNGTNGTHCRGGIFAGMTSLTTVGHGTFDENGKFTPITYTEGVADLTGFTLLTPRPGYELKKAAFYFAGMFYQCESVSEVILPKTLTYDGKYKISVEKDGAWSSSDTVEVEAVNDEFGGEYSGIVGMWMFYGALSLNKVTIPEGVEVKVLETNLFVDAPVRCITVKGTISPDIKIDADAFSGVMDGCIIQCANEADIEVLNNALTAAGITNVKAVDMNTQPTPAPVITKVPTAPEWKEFNPEGATAYGELDGDYTKIYWAYYQDTKTITFTSKISKGYNQTAPITSATDGVGWEAYKTEIEHAVIGPKINKLIVTTFAGMTSLKDICITSNISAAAGTFSNCPNLTTIWIEGGERVEGQAKLTSAQANFKLDLKGTAVETIHMGCSPVSILGNIQISQKTTTIIMDFPSQDVIDYCKENYLNIRNSGGESFGDWYVATPEGLPYCGDNAVFDFDEETGTLSILGKGKITDIKNYWGGGSKSQPWIDIRDNIKHVVIGDYITAIGKYAFTECKNLETVELPAKEGFAILSSAFQECNNLKSVYIRGNQPIEGTVDVSVLDRFETYMFANCYLIANVVINENVDKIGASVFENCVNIQNIYGVPESFAQEYAMDNGFTFFDKSANTPQPITCTPPSDETTAPETDTDVTPDTTVDTAPDMAPDTTPDTTVDTTPDTQPANGDDDNQTTSEDGTILPIAIVVVSIVVVAVVVTVVVIAKKKARKTE